ncbi:MAG: hypothetical protein KGJ02_03020 [Verrucomicrobiota bacterium]|nr:hypothetical protein [Verrucomicrobiota bacterium]
MLRFFFVVLAAALHAKTVYFTPIGGLDMNKLFYEPYSYRDECSKPFCVLREALEAAGYKVKFSLYGEDLEDFTAFISLTEDNDTLLQNLSKVPRARCFLHMFESPIILPSLYRKSLSEYFGKIYVLNSDLVDNVNRFQMYYVQPRMELIEPVVDFAQKKLCAMMSGNKDSMNPKSLYRERKQVIQFFARSYPKEFDLYGPGWEVDRTAAPCWKGFAVSKWDTLKNYRFSFCYENAKDQRGYITEKIFDSMIAGCVPIYWGAEDIGKFVPGECFIDRRQFSTTRDLYRFLKTMSRETYENYIEAIRKYFKTPRAKFFSIEHFVQTILKDIKEADQ